MDPDPPRRPRRRDEAKEFFKPLVNFFKERFGSRTPSPSRSRAASRPNVAEDTGTSSRASHDVLKPNPPAEGPNRGDIRGHRDNIDAAIGRQPPQAPFVQANQSTSLEAIPSLPAQNEENMFIPSAPTFDHDGAPQVSSLASSGRLARPQGEVEHHIAAAHIEHPSQDPRTVAIEGVPTDQSNNLAASTSQVANEPQVSPAHVELQSQRLASKVYEGVKTTLRRIVDVSDVFPPLKSTAAGLLVICDTIDVSLFSNEIRSSLPICV